jgi:S-methylmethionine-dependent homocysteine/selenocysteine methylase
MTKRAKPMNANAKRPLPHIDGRTYLTDGGFETTLIFHDGWNLPIGEAFVLLESEIGRKAIRDYFDRYLPMAVKHGTGFILESPTWRANPDWAAKAGYNRYRLAELNRAGIALMREVRTKYETPRTPIIISGNIGPRGDGYDPGALMSVSEATAYHAWQISIFREENVDCVSAFTMTNVKEAIGVTLAAKQVAVPCVISFTLETDGRLPTGETLGEAITAVDRASGAAPAYFMINCAPAHWRPAQAGSSACAPSARIPRAKAMPSSTIRLSSTPAIRRSLASNMPRCCGASRTSTCWAAVAGRITATSRLSARPAAATINWRRHRNRRARGSCRARRYSSSPSSSALICSAR